MATILVIDDDQNICALIAVALKCAHTVIEAHDGQEGLRFFIDHDPDLIITDMHMPVLSGYDLIYAIRSTLSKVKIIAMSGCFSDADKAMALKAGANICLDKPTSLVTYRQMVIELLGQKANRAYDEPQLTQQIFPI
jgi:DNA-binding response OmpR family regulator